MNWMASTKIVLKLDEQQNKKSCVGCKTYPSSDTGVLEHAAPCGL